MKYFIVVFGCQMNYADAERIITLLQSLGYQAASTLEEADLLVVNMCSVRQSAVDRVYGLAPKITKQKKTNPAFRSLLTGCILPSDQRKFKKFFDLILDRQELSSWPKKLDRAVKNLSVNHYLKIPQTYQSPFQAFVPIMTGCNYRCSYCIVPLTRRREYYRPTNDILEEIKELAQEHYQEIWLLGQNVNHYASTYHSEKIDFNRLLQLIEKIKGDFWLYFTSPYPRDFSEESIITIAKSHKLAPSLNLPLQSGDNDVLQKMNRLYSVEQYKTLIKKIRSAFLKYRKGLDRYPNISTDIIVGFPGESQEAFRHTVEAFQDIKFDAAHIAAYSPRPQTAAALLKNQIPDNEKKKRVKELTAVLAKTALENNKRYLSQTINVLVEKEHPSHQALLGRSFSYKAVKIKGSVGQQYIGKKVSVKINKVGSWQLEGEKIPTKKN